MTALTPEDRARLEAQGLLTPVKAPKEKRGRKSRTDAVLGKIEKEITELPGAYSTGERRGLAVALAIVRKYNGGRG